MPTVFDDKFRALARKLIAKFGPSQPASYTHITATGGMDNDTNTVIGDTSDTQLIATTPLLSVKKLDMGSGTIFSTDSVIYIAGEDWDVLFTSDPRVGDQVTLNGEDFRVIELMPLNSGDQMAAYKLFLRRGPNA